MKTRIFGLAGMVLVVAVSLFGAAATGSSASNRGDVRPNISITTLPTTITQDFNTLLSSGSATWTNNSTLTGWYHARTGTGTTIVANDGSSNAGNFYSYGTGTNIERALGSLGSGNAAVGNLFWGILLTNNTGSTITTLDVSYTGEQWRNSAAAAQTVSFSYLVGTGLTGSLVEFQSAGTPVASLDFTSPITGGAAAALDGNLAANRIVMTFTITGLNVANGQDIMLRWSDIDHTGADHGLSVDDFSVTASGGGPTPTPGPSPTPTPTSTPTPGPSPTPPRIRDIQGAAHRSPLDAQVVAGVPGIVTGKVSNGFYLQDPSPDANEATSEGIFVFTSSAPTVNVGDAILVGGTVVEFRPGGSSTTNLTTTEISAPGLSVAVQSTGNPLPPPIVVGTGGRIPPMTVIDDDATGSVETSGTFDPATDGIDFYESLEGMRVQINGAVAVGPRTDFGEIPVLSDDGANAVVRTARGGIVVRSTDFNPERVFLDDSILATPVVNVGDHFAGPAVGVMDYSFGNFKLQITQALTAVSGGLTRETTAIPTATQLAIATFNVENLDPGDPPAQFSALASLIVNNLRSPDILTLEEVQDNNGPTNDAVVDATTTYNTLIAAIQAAGGPTYSFRQVNPVDDQDGGEPGGNIRVGFLFRTDRGLAFVDRAGGCSTCATTVSSGGSGVQLSFSPGRVDPTNAAFNSSRKPLAGEFTFNGQKLFLIANHFNSKGGDDPLFGRFQPPVLSSETQRNQQAQIVNNFVDSILALDSSAKIVILGDLNDFHFSTPINTLKGGVLHALIETLPQSERYTYVFEGNSQDLDHILVSDSLFSGLFEYDVVHVNSEFADQISDHDPQVVRLPLGASPTPTATPTVTATATVAPTATATATASATATIAPPATATATVAPTATATVAPTATATATVAPTATATATATVAPSATASPTCPPQLTEGFESVAAIFNTGWAENNNSEPLGASTWVQGAPGSGLGAAQGGTTNSFIVVNFNSTTGTGTISNWLFTPVLNLQDGATLTFWTRGPTGSTFPDRLQVRMSLAGASVNVGTTSTDVGVFTALLVDINPTLAVGGYPQVWTQFTATVTGVPGQQLGRMAFRYFVTNAGPSGANSDIIGIDTVAFNGPCGPTPTPGTPTPTATATATPTATVAATPTATATPCDLVFSENFDGVVAPALPPGWTGANWVTSTVTPDTPPNCAFVDNPPFISDRPLDTPSIVIPSASAVLSFRNYFNTDSSGGTFWDGGVLEVSINGGVFTDITDPAVGANVISGGYTGEIDGTDGNPLAGRMAWSGDSGGYINTVVNLGPILNGQTIRLRFRLGTGNAGNAPGWRIDTFVITGGSCGTPTPTPPSTPSATPTATPTATATPPVGGTPTPSPTLTPSPSATPSPSPITKAINLSTRMRVETGDRVGIGGFIITGTTPKNVIIRAIGPTLADLGVPDALADPVLELHGPDSFATIINNDWRDEQEAEIQATGIPPTDNFESAIVATLAPETYTAIVRGNGNSSGVALVEVYDLNQGVDSKLANLSTRAFVSTNDNIVIAGFLLSDNNVKDRIIVRGIGPSLAPAIFPASAVLADPTLELRDNNGSLILSNNDWQDNAGQAAEISAAGLAPSNDLESAIAATLPPGLYTALLAGLNNGTGIGVVEIYDRGP